MSISIEELFYPEQIIHYGGLILVLIIVFIETGLFFGFFLPGDSLLFTAGLLCGTNILDTSIHTLIITICIAAILGSLVGYIFGRKVGIRLFSRKDSIFFKKRYVEIAESFYSKYGGMALVLGRFLPIVRTFAPILAGIIRMRYGQFMFYNIIGGILWSLILVLGGYFLGKEFPFIKNYLEYIVWGLIIITAVPILKIIYTKRKVLQTSIKS